MKAVIESIRAHTRFEIITHAWPDEDAVGSSRALARALTGLNKTVRLVFPTPVPEMLLLEALPPQPEVTPEISLLLDVSDLGMIADVRPAGEIVVIDHHRSNSGYGAIAWVEAERSSTSEMVYELLAALAVPLDAAIAAQLYLGLFGDTGGFTHANTGARVLQIAAALVTHGADAHAIADRLKRHRPLTWYRILALVIDRLVIRGGVYASHITQADLERLQATPEDASGIITELASLAGAELAIFLRDIDAQEVHCSLRSRTTPAARKTAEAFGGGGHDRAAGFSRPGRAAEYIERVIAEGQQWVRTA